MSDIRRKKVALLFRYGLMAHAELHQIIPACLEELAREIAVVYIGPRSPAANPAGVRLVSLPYSVDRSSTRDKLWKTVLWYLLLPFLSLRCRFQRTDLIWVDESLPLLGRIVQIFSGRPVMLTVVDFFLEVYREEYPWLKHLAKLDYVIEKQSWKRARAIVTRTASMRDHLIQEGIDPHKIIMIRDVFDPSVFRPETQNELRVRLGFRPEDLVLVHHGILHPNKGIGRVMEWIIPLMKNDPHIKFLVIGEGPELKRLKARVDQEDLGAQVVFTGWLGSSSSVSEYLNAADVGLVMRIGQATDHFHVTGTLVHCLLCGLPVLAARLDGICEIVTEGSEGCLFDPSNGTEFLQKFEQLIQNEPARRLMGENGRRKALAEFSPAVVLAKTVQALRQYSDS